MDYYFSGGGGGRGVWRSPNEEIIRRGLCRLVSHAYDPNQIPSWLELLSELRPARPIKVLQDSGAFSAWTRGVPLSRDELAGLFGRTMASPWVDARLINLDRIPGRKGIDPTPSEVAAAMDESDDNFDWLNERFPGRVLPVYHQGEPRAYLDRLAERSDYVCLSPRNDLPEHLRVAWAQSAHAGLTVRTHGLATTGHAMMTTSPWASVDSAAWNMVTAYGGIYIPVNGRLSIIAVSSESAASKEADKHIDSVADVERGAIEALIQRHGYSLERLAVDQPYRAAWNVVMVSDWLLTLEQKHVYQPGLF